MKLIDADKLIALWYEINDIDKDDRGARFVGYTEIVSMINSIPTIDAVEVVRCKNCKENKYCFLLPNDDDYCSKGERKE